MEDTMKKGSVLDLLLNGDLPDVRKKLPEKRMRIDRLSELAGHDVIFTLRGIPYKDIRQVQKKTDAIAVNMVLEGCVEPNFHDKRLLNPEKNIATPIDAITAMLTPGEIDELSVEIQMLDGYIVRTLSEVKNA